MERVEELAEYLDHPAHKDLFDEASAPWRGTRSAVHVGLLGPLEGG
jgi:hypothetical protein